MADFFPLSNAGGVPLFSFFVHNWEKVQHFQAREDDVLINTYPKSGTSWMSEIVHLIFSYSDTKKTKHEPTYERPPFIDWAAPGFPSGVEILDDMKSPRAIRCHFRTDNVPPSFKENNCKIIYVARNPKDVMVSYYYFHRMCSIFEDPGTMQEFLQKFIKGKVPYGSWTQHVKEWWKIKDEKNVLFIFYEDMLENLDREIRKVMKFLEKDLPNSVVKKICQRVTFKAMKEDQMINYAGMPQSFMDQTISPFLRKGLCGDWKYNLTVAENEVFDAYLKREMSDTDLTFRYQI